MYLSCGSIPFSTLLVFDGMQLETRRFLNQGVGERGYLQDQDPIFFHGRYVKNVQK